MTFDSAAFQILLLDRVFSLDSTVTTVGMTVDVPIHGNRSHRRGNRDAARRSARALHRQQSHCRYDLVHTHQ
jgi:hypothetical protein